MNFTNYKYTIFSEKTTKGRLKTPLCPSMFYAFSRLKTCPAAIAIRAVIAIVFYASILAYVALASINSRRGSTSSPISIEKI